MATVESEPSSGSAVLECPSEELKLLRKQLLVEQLMKSPKSSKTGTKGGKSSNLPNGPSVAERKTMKLPPSSLLNRVKSFLPQMKSANEELLSAEDKSSHSVETVPTTEEETSGQPFIEMSLAMIKDGGGSDSSSEDVSTDDSSSSDSEEDMSMDTTDGKKLHPKIQIPTSSSRVMSKRSKKNCKKVGSQEQSSFPLVTEIFSELELPPEGLVSQENGISNGHA